MDRIWRIEVLGGLRIRGDGPGPYGFRLRKYQELLGLLAVELDKTLPRDTVAERVWPGLTSYRSHAHLRDALCSLRKQLEPPTVEPGCVLVAGRGDVRLSAAAVATDLDDMTRLETRLRAEKDPETRLEVLEKATALYIGPLLDGVEGSWIGDYRGRVTRTAGRLFGWYSGALEHAGRLDQALLTISRAAEILPSDEVVCAQLLRLLLQSGRPREAYNRARRYQYRIEKRLWRCGPDLREVIRQVISASRRAQYAATSYRAAVAVIAPDSPDSPASPAPRDEPNPAQLTAPRRPDDANGCSRRRDRKSATGTADTVRPNGSHPSAVSVRLPTRLTPFFGRTDEIAQIGTMIRSPGPCGATEPASTLAATRLLTLTGAGGCGKTRLAVEAARTLADVFETIAFVALADVDLPSQISDAILGALGVRRNDAADGPAEVARSLRGVRTLLVLDNMEHLLAGDGESVPPEEACTVTGTSDGSGGSVESVIRHLLEALPELTCLTTSREALQIEGEVILSVGPLPAPGVHGTPARLLELPAVRLYVDRAQRVLPDFRLSERNAGDVVAICRQLEGLPLAIELAASHSRVLTPSQVRSQLPGNAGLLSARRRAPGQRHASMDATIAWSLDRLAAGPRDLFAMLGVFRGGCTLEAASALFGPDYAGAAVSAGAQAAMEELAERSLVNVEHDGDGARYRLLEPLRAVALRRLTGHQREEYRQRHRDYFVRLAEEEVAHLRSPRVHEALARLDADRENLRAAVAYAGASAPGIRLVAALWRWEITRGNLLASRRRLETALNCEPLPDDPAVAEALTGLGAMTMQLADLPSAELALKRALALQRTAGDRAAAARTLNLQALLADQRGELDAAERLNRDSLAVFRELHDLWSAAGCLNNLGRRAERRGEVETAEALFEESQAIYAAAGDNGNAATILHNLGTAAGNRGDLDAARRSYARSLALFTQLGHRTWTAMAAHNLGEVLLRLGHLERAQRHLRDALALRHAVADVPGVLDSLLTLADLAARTQAWNRATRLAETYRRLTGRLGMVPTSAASSQLAAIVRAVEENLQPAALRAARAYADAVEIDAAVSYALEQPLAAPPDGRAPAAARSFAT